MNNFFKKNKFCVIRNSIDKDIIKIFSLYALFEKINYNNTGEKQGFNQVPNAHAEYADPLMESLLIYFKNKIEIHVGIQLEPTYSFYRVYTNGDMLPKHKDRPSCEISASLCLGYSYDEEEYSWPIFIDNHEINLFPGDMVVYRGMDVDHWRESFDFYEQSWHAQAFLHYIEKNGSQMEWKFDKRNFIGQKSYSQ